MQTNSISSCASQNMSMSISNSSIDTIRQHVSDRHWELFELRLKSSMNEKNEMKYTKSNNYHIIDRLRSDDQSQKPIQPNQRWKTFCHQLTSQTNEIDRIMSLLHNVWINNWNENNKYEKQTKNENTFLACLSSNESDKKVISSILHRDN